MKVTEILLERLDYSKYLPILKRIIKNTFYSINSDEDLYDPQSKVNQFFYDLQDDIDSQILKPLLKENPITINGNKVNHLLMSFNVTYDEPIGRLNIDSLNQHVADTLSAKYPKQEFKASSDITARYLRSHTSFTGEAEFSYEDATHNGLIKMDVRGSSVANYAFLSDDSKVLTASLEQLTNNIIGGIIHEVKHYIQSTNVAKNMGYNAQVNKFYTGDPKKLSADANLKNKQYNTTKGGYWLNADEMNSWSANAAAEINSVFGNDEASMLQYMNATMSNKPFSYNGVPVNTSLDHYRKMIFDKRHKINVNRDNLWRKFVKDVYKDIQMYKPTPSQTPQSKPV